MPADLALARPEPGMWPLAMLMAGASPAMLSSVAERIAHTDLLRAERGELTGILARPPCGRRRAGLRLHPDTAAQLVRRNPMLREWLQESSFAELLR